MSDLFERYPTGAAWDEVVGPDGIRPPYNHVHAELDALTTGELRSRAESLRRSSLAQGVDVAGEVRPFPLDIVPRVITAREWGALAPGVAQRVRALEALLDDVYGRQRVVADGVLPRAVVVSSARFTRAARGILPPNGVRVHVAGIDVVRDGADRWRVLDDNVRVPSGVSHVLSNRRALAQSFPELIASLAVRPVADHPQRLLHALRASAPEGVDDPVVVVLTPGVHSSAYHEHSLLARLMGVELVEGRDLFVAGGRVYMRTTAGRRRVDVVYRRVDDDFIDPVVLRPDSLLGCPGLLGVARAGNVTLANAVGNGVADDKLVYTYVPDLIRYYLGEEPILENVDTWRLGEPAALEEVCDRLEELVVKPVDGSGGTGIVIGPAASRDELDAVRRRLRRDPRGWIAQPVVQLSTLPTLAGDKVRPRHVDLRAFAVNDGEKVWVLPGGLTRVALREGQLVVSSSRGGGSKDTWVLGERRAPGHRGAPDAAATPAAERPVVAGVPRDGHDDGGSAARAAGRGAPRGEGGGVMLSRIAESLFSIGRYVERADGTARLLDVHLQLLLEDPRVEEETACRSLLAIMDLPGPADGTVGRRYVLDRLAYDRAAPASVAGALGAAREAAGRAREVISTELWECLSTTWNTLPAMTRGRRAHDYLHWVRERAAVVAGVVDSATGRDHTWQFLVLGRSVERADMTARLVASRAVAGGPTWGTLLRSCGAYEAFLHTYRGRIGDAQAAQFLLVDRHLPRSVVHALDRAERCLAAIEGPQATPGVQEDAARILGRARSHLEYLPMAQLQTNLLGEMETVKVACSRASDAVRARYFLGEPTDWVGERP
ncbi:circularly permuted type 2 ATP-grasp protein [Georgenia sp. AZ-5]|uniref:circularly permuted type 2 ATP-grasp protein n=1 Tax=Georgenia sp. AZ-5 TaxID=3367526 RepID=UPI0037546EEB